MIASMVSHAGQENRDPLQHTFYLHRRFRCASIPCQSYILADQQSAIHWDVNLLTISGPSRSTVHSVAHRCIFRRREAPRPTFAVAGHHNVRSIYASLLQFQSCQIHSIKDEFVAQKLLACVRLNLLEVEMSM